MPITKIAMIHVPGWLSAARTPVCREDNMRILSVRAPFGATVEAAWSVMVYPAFHPINGGGAGDSQVVLKCGAFRYSGGRRSLEVPWCRCAPLS